MAKAPPPPKKQSGKGSPPTNAYPKLTETAPKTVSADYVGLNFRVPPDFAYEFKEAALRARKKQNAFLAELLEFYKTHSKKK